MEQQFRLLYDDMVKSPNLAMSLFNVIQPKCDFQFLFIRHPEHACYLSDKLTKMYIVMRIFYAIKFANRELVSNKRKPGESARRDRTSRKIQKVLHK